MASALCAKGLAKRNPAKAGFLRQDRGASLDVRHNPVPANQLNRLTAA